MKFLFSILIILIFAVSCRRNDSPLSVPAAPTGLTAIATSASQVNLSWTDNSNNEAGFKINRKSGADSFKVIATVGANMTIFKDTGLTAHVTYIYIVYSYNNTGTSNPSDTVSVTPSGIFDSTKYVPVLTTKQLDSLGQTSVVTGGVIKTDSGFAVTAKGVVWDTLPTPTVKLATKTLNGTGKDAFRSIVTGLTPNKIYYIRAYATNNAGTGYGNELHFTTDSLTAPYISLASLTIVGSTSIVIRSSVDGTGGSNLTASGIVWSTHPNPTIDLVTKTTDGKYGSFSSSLTGLNPDSTYYIRAYASNSVGTNYANQLIFQVWMKRNLDVTLYRNGDVIPQVTDATQWANLKTGAWCYYNNDPAIGAVYGKLYNWYAITDPRGLAPLGWHIPSSSEWDNLVNALGGQFGAGGKLKSTNNWYSPNTGATNVSGFTCLPGGDRDIDGSFYGIGIYGGWISTYTSGGNVYSRSLSNQGIIVTINYGSPVAGYSVRCIKDY